MAALDELPELTTVAQAAAYLHIGEATFYAGLAKRTFPFPQISVRIGGRWRVSRHRLGQLVRGEIEQPQPAASERVAS